jgi:YD repeat-containing protein
VNRGIASKIARKLVILICFMAFAGTAFAGTVTYTYDDAGRLIQATDNGTMIEYQYDNVGNLQQRLTRYIVTADPPTKDFGAVNVNSTSAAQSFVVTNGGSVAITIGSVSVTGPNASYFPISSESCTGVTLTPSASCSIQSAFSPATIGGKSGNIQLSFSDPSSLTLTIPLSGTGTDSENLVTPLSIAFGNVGIATISVGQTVTITNGGNINLVTGALSITGTDSADFQILTPDTCSGQSIMPSGTCSAQVVFAPASVGDKSASLSIPSNDITNPTVAVSLTGTGVYYIRISRAQPAYFTTLQAAYDAAADGEVIQVQAATLVENVNFNHNISVTVDGGYDSNFITNDGGVTLIKGSLQTSAGTADIKNVRVVQ